MEHSSTVILPRSEHCISRDNIDPDALKVLYRLSQNGHTAYLVGGGVRDLLRGEHPKDFDIATSAHPGQIKRLFRNAFLIGKRFRLAHIRFGSKAIETSTFRRQPDVSEDGAAPGADLLQQHDNTFGTPEEDARRRDFTVNGLFYDIRTFSVIDHVGGLADLHAGIIRSIGDPNVRFREDPVRMLRAVRFAARMGFRIEEQTREAILHWHAELAKASPARLLDEVHRLYRHNAAEPAFRLLRETRLLRVVFPEVDACLDEHAGTEDLLWRCLAALDRASPPEGPSQALAFGVTLCGLFRRRVQSTGLQGPRHTVHEQVAHEVVVPAAERLHMPRMVRLSLVHMFADQHRFEVQADAGRGSRSPGFSRARFMHREWFIDALQLYRINSEAAGRGPAVADAWQQDYASFASATRPETAARPAGEGDDRAERSPLDRPRRRRRGGRRRGRGGRDRAVDRSAPVRVMPVLRHLGLHSPESPLPGIPAWTII